MKDCCKTDNYKENKLKKWFNYFIYVIVAGIILFAVSEQF